MCVCVLVISFPISFYFCNMFVRDGLLLLGTADINLLQFSLSLCA